MQFPKTAIVFLVVQATACLVSDAFVFPTTRTPFVARSAPVVNDVGVAEASEVSDEAPAPEEVEAPVVGEVEAPVEEEVEASAEEEEVEEEAPAAEAPEVVEAPERFVVYVNNLPFAEVDDQLAEIFNTVGTVKQVSVPKRKDSEISRGFGFVDFETKEEMEKAVAELNGYVMDGRELSVSVSLPKEQLPKRPSVAERNEARNRRKVYVGNLPFGIEKEAIADHFEQYGEVEFVYIAKGKDGEDRGFGFVTMAEEIVEAVVEGADGSELDGRRLTVRKPNPEGVKSKRANTRVYLGNLAFETTEETMEDLLREHGRIIKLTINKDPRTGQSRGFGFAEMESAGAQDAINALDGTEVDGREIKVTFAEKKIPKMRIYCGNLSFDAEEDQVTGLFSEFGEVFDIYMPRESDGSSRGFAILNMGVRDGTLAVNALEGAELDGRILRVNEARPKGAPAPRSETTKIYVGNLSFDTEEATVRETFEEYGEVLQCFLPEDAEFGGSRGFGFVTMNRDDGDAAIAELNGIELDGRSIRVVEAEPPRAGRGPPPPRNDDYDDYDDDDDYDDEY